VVAHSTVAKAAGALGTETGATTTAANTTGCGRRVDTTIHIATVHVDGACVVVITVVANQTATPVGMTIAIIGIVPVIAIPVVVPGIIPAYRTVIQGSNKP
jgi:hypothetical protein